jgi:hypothetical protein
MQLPSLTNTILGFTAILPLTFAQNCFGDATGIDKPNWNIKYAFALREAMCSAGGCQSPSDPFDVGTSCTKKVVPDKSYVVNLRGNVTDQTSTQFSQSCFDKVVRLVIPSYSQPSDTMQQSIISTCLEPGFQGGEIPGEYRFTLDLVIGGTLDPNDPRTQTFVSPKDVNKEPCKQSGEEATSQDQCCIGMTFCPEFGKCLQGSHGGSAC